MKTVNLFSNEKHHHNSAGSCVSERILTFAKIAELSERCEAVRRTARLFNRFTPPLTFVVPANQVVASISRFVE